MKLSKNDKVKRSSIRIFLLFVCTLALGACGPKIDFGLGWDVSPPEGDFTNPSEMRVSLSLDKTTRPDGTVNQRITVWCEESSRRSYMVIRGGGVSVNGKTMSSQVAGLGFGPIAGYYLIEDLSIVPNKLYKFIFTLSDQSTYETTIRVQDLKVFNLPESHNPNNDLAISWQEVNPQYPLTLSMYTTTASGLQTRLQLPDSCLSSGRCTIPSSFFSSGFHSRGIDEVSTSLTSIKSGKLGGFGPNSEFTSAFVIKKTLKLDHR